MITDGFLVQQWALHFFLVLFFVGGLVTLGLGMGLLVWQAPTLRFMDAANRWVSLRRTFRALEIPRDIAPTVEKHRRWLAAVFMLGAVFTIFVLTTQFDARVFSVVFAGQGVSPAVAAWAGDALRWLLVVGNVFAIVLSVMLCFFPQAWTALEAKGGHWYSHRQALRNADNMNLALDRWIATYPRTSGAIITVASLILVADFGIMLLSLR